MDRLGANRGISGDTPKPIQAAIEAKAEEIMDKAREEFDRWLEVQGYENAMGMIVKVRKGKRK